jgi:hexokinase
VAHAFVRVLTTDYIADSVDAFLTEIGSDVAPEKGGPMHLGFTFS